MSNVECRMSNVECRMLKVWKPDVYRFYQALALIATEILFVLSP